MRAHREALLAVYEEVYADKPHDPFFGPDRFWERLASYAQWPGFSLVTLHDDDLIGPADGAPRASTAGTWRALHDALLRRRPERRATLLVKPDNLPARTAYLSWGWELFGQVRPFEDAPVYDSLMLTSMPDQGGEGGFQGDRSGEPGGIFG